MAVGNRGSQVLEGVFFTLLKSALYKKAKKSQCDDVDEACAAIALRACSSFDRLEKFNGSVSFDQLDCLHAEP